MIRRGSSLTRVSPFFFSLSLSLIQLLLSIHKRRTIIDFLAKVLPGISHATHIFLFESTKRGYNAFPFNRENCVRSSGVLHRFFLFFFSLFRNYYSGHLALIRVLVQRVFPRLSFYLFSVMEFNASAVAKCAAQSESRYA